MQMMLVLAATAALNWALGDGRVVTEAVDLVPFGRQGVAP